MVCKIKIMTLSFKTTKKTQLFILKILKKISNWVKYQSLKHISPRHIIFKRIYQINFLKKLKELKQVLNSHKQFINNLKNILMSSGNSLSQGNAYQYKKRNSVSLSPNQISEVLQLWDSLDNQYLNKIEQSKVLFLVNVFKINLRIIPSLKVNLYLIVFKEIGCICPNTCKNKILVMNFLL